MADDADRVIEQMEREERRYERNRARKVHTLPTTQMCYECAEPLKDNKIFCDSECRDMYEKRRDARVRNNGF